MNAQTIFNLLIVGTACGMLTACPAPPEDPQLRKILEDYLSATPVTNADLAINACHFINTQCSSVVRDADLHLCESMRQRVPAFVWRGEERRCTAYGYVGRCQTPDQADCFRDDQNVVYPPVTGNVIGTTGGSGSR